MVRLSQRHGPVPHGCGSGGNQSRAGRQAGLLVTYALLLLAPAAAQPIKRPFDVYTLQRMVRVGDPQISPDGSRVAFTAERVFLTENSKERQIWLVPVEGGEPTQATYQGETSSRPRWSPDGESLAYVSDRSGTPQVWLMKADGSETRQVTHLSTGADGVLFSPAGDRLVRGGQRLQHRQAVDERLVGLSRQHCCYCSNTRPRRQSDRRRAGAATTIRAPEASRLIAFNAPYENDLY